MRKTAVAALLLLVLAGCTQVKGTVLEKHHDPHVMIMIKGQDYGAPECWRLVLDTGDVCVTKDVWDQVEIGDKID